jgi:RNA polymerase sigma-70 factor (ECF subfamily)
MSANSDRLIHQYLQGDVGAFETLYDRYAPRLLGFLISLGGDREAAEDLAQKTWVRVLESIERYEPKQTFRSWLFTVAYRLWLDDSRSAWKRLRSSPEGAEEEIGSFEESIPAAQDDPREIAVRKEESDLLAWAIAQLPCAMRETVLLRVDADMTFREIGERMECPLGTVLWRMQSAQKKLRELLEMPEMDAGVQQWEGYQG